MRCGAGSPAGTGMDVRPGACTVKRWLMREDPPGRHWKKWSLSSDFNTVELSAVWGCPPGWHMPSSVLPTPWHISPPHCSFCFHKGLCLDWLPTGCSGSKQDGQEGWLVTRKDRGKVPTMFTPLRTPGTQQHGLLLYLVPPLCHCPQWPPGLTGPTVC